MWWDLPAVREAKHKVRVATQTLVAARPRADGMAQACTDYAKLRPAREALDYGTPYNASQRRQADLAAGRAEASKRDAEHQPLALAKDSNLLVQYARQRDAQVDAVRQNKNGLTT